MMEPTSYVFEDRAASVGCRCGRWVIPAQTVPLLLVRCHTCHTEIDSRYARAPLGIRSWWYKPCGRAIVGPFDTDTEALNFAASP